MLALLTVLDSWTFWESRGLVQVFPEHVRILWGNWELRVLVLVSLTLQLCLLHFGSRRRYSVKTWLRVILWLSYLAADSVATVALGVIANNQGNCNDSQLQNELIVFWAPFLLLHLGGQDTITAYAVQDNELWLRHLLGLIVQSAVGLYIILLSWKDSWLSFLTIPVFLNGFLKYAERIWVLRSANYVPSFDYTSQTLTEEMGLALGNSHTSLEPTSRNINRGIFDFFNIFRCLFLNQKVGIRKGVRSYSNFCDSQTAWNVIEGELGYAYDVYYTKAPLFFTTWGLLLRLFSFTSNLFVFVLFLVNGSHKRPVVDLIVTYLLLVGAILMEIYAVVLLCASDWPFQWDGQYDGWFGNCIETLLTPIRSGSAKLTGKQRWSNSMCKLNLLGLCLKDQSLQDGDGTPKLLSNMRGWALNKLLPKLNGELEMLLYVTNKQVSDDLKDFVFKSFRSGSEWNRNGFPEEFDIIITNGTGGVDPYQSIIIWHIATDLCFCNDGGEDNASLLQSVSKDVSDYMMYLAMHPLVLSTGNAKRCFENVCKAVKSTIFKENLSKLTKDQVCAGLIKANFDFDILVRDALWTDKELCRLAVALAKKLNMMPDRWEILSSFWVDSLANVATRCRGYDHAQLLRNGGEFLTHFWFLKYHFILTGDADDELAV